MFLEAVLLKTVGSGALQNLLSSKAEGFREALSLNVERDTSILPVARMHQTNGFGDEASISWILFSEAICF